MMKEYIGCALGGDCNQQAKNMIPRMNVYYEEVRKLFKEEMKIYNKAFKNNYEMLDIMPIDMAQSKYHLPEDIKIETANISSAANYIAEKVSSENMAFFGGVAAGAAVGTAIAPGIGTIISGIVGFVAGGGWAPDVNAVRNECKDKLRPQLTHNKKNKLESVMRQSDYLGRKEK